MAKQKTSRAKKSPVKPVKAKTRQVKAVPKKVNKRAKANKAKKLARARHIRTALTIFTIIAVAASTFSLKDGSQMGLPASHGLAFFKTQASKPATTRHSKAKSAKPLGPVQQDPQFATYPAWAQDFANYGSSLPSRKYWNINLGWPQNGNNEAEYYTNNPANLRISNGALVMEATQQPEPGGLQYASSRIDTGGKKSFLYGRFDVTAELPSGVGTWPAIWFLSANTKYEDLSPPSDTTRFLNGGEIDMAEAVGLNPYVVYGVVHTLQTNQNNPNAVGDFSQISLPANDVSFNKYSLLWTPTSITLEINDSPFFTYARPQSADYTTWPFDQPFYMIMNLALGGVWGGEDSAQFPPNGIDNSALPASMRIKSIYYYPYIWH